MTTGQRAFAPYAFSTAVAAGALALTLVVGMLPFVRYAYEAPALHARWRRPAR